MFRGIRKVAVEEISKPVPSADEVLVEFRGGSICGTDLHLYRGEWTFMKLGQIMGYDAWGIRTDTHQRVVMVPIISCGSCYFCLHGPAFKQFNSPMHKVT